MNPSETVHARAADAAVGVRRRRIELGEFLKQRRNALLPAEVGLEGGGRRHVRGLRRDEVAEAAAIGVSWYAMLEQGRAANVTRETLDGVASALRLTPPEREYLMNLAEAAFTRTTTDPRTPPEALLNFVRTFRLGGAFVHSSRCDVVAWNTFADEQFRFSKHGPNPNVLKIMLEEPSLRTSFVSPEWSEVFERMIGNFRRSRGQFGDASHDALIDELVRYPEFAKLWRRHPVIPPPAERGRMDHPVRGRLDVSVIAFYSPSCPTYQLILTLPVRERSDPFADADARQRIYSTSLGEETIRLRREELGGFLRSRRERLTPADVGLRATGRRHVKGLRREEVALAAEIGSSWYALLEQGRVENVSSRTLGAIADALRLSVRERIYVRSLAARSFAELLELNAPPMPELLEFIRNFPDGHAHFHDGRFDMFAWNQIADDLYGFSEEIRPNLLDMMARKPRMRGVYVTPDWLATMKRMIAHFRFTFSRFGDNRYASLIEELSAASPEFAELWSQEPTVTEPGPMGASFRYADGTIRRLDFLALVPHASPEYTLIFKLPPGNGQADALLAEASGFGAATMTKPASSEATAAPNQIVG